MNHFSPSSLSSSKSPNHVFSSLTSIIQSIFSSMLLFIIVFQLSSALNQLCNPCDVENLIAESHYRAVKLSWDYRQTPEPEAFIVKYCELSIWNTSLKCRERRLRNEPISLQLVLLNPQLGQSSNSVDGHLNQPVPNNLYDRLLRRSSSHFEALIYDLRTLTNYTFQVRPELTGNSIELSEIDNTRFKMQTSKSDAIYKNDEIKMPLTTINVDKLDLESSSFQNTMPIGNSVIVETKGFTAQTSRCLSNVSDVLVHTGPLFNGKISVENSNSDDCAVYGNRTSTQQVYQLTILHDKCGSKVLNNSRIETMIIVHENKEILTHNSRRFLVVCHFLPEAYTLRASVALPASTLRRPSSSSGSVTSVGRLQPARSVVQPLPRPLKKWRTRLSSHQTQPPLEQLGYTFERLRSGRDSRMLNHNLKTGNHHHSYQSEADAKFNNILTIILIGLGSVSLFVIIIFNFISIPKIWSQPAPRHSARHRTHRHRTSRTSMDQFSPYIVNHQLEPTYGSSFQCKKSKSPKSLCSDESNRKLSTVQQVDNDDCMLKLASLGESFA